MNKCRYCGETATVHLTDIVNKKKRQTFLCEACAKKKNLISDDPTPQLNLTPLLHLIMGQMGMLEPEKAANPDGLTCESCGLKYAQFKAGGRLGCPHDYDAFRPTLEPLLDRIHRSLTHTGKVPVRERRRSAAATMESLARQLKEAIESERYEDAARIRDMIRAKDTPV